MALVIGTNCGFVTVAPTTNPDVGGLPIDYYARATKFTSPVGEQTITEMGWFLNGNPGDPGEEWQLGIYNDNGGKPGTLLASATGIIGVAATWQVASSFEYVVASETDYWLAAVQAASSPQTDCAWFETGGDDYSLDLNTDTLANPWVEASSGVYLMGIYAKYGGSSVAPALVFGCNF